MRSLLSKSQRAWLWPVALAAAIVAISDQSDVPGPGLLHFDKLAHFAVFGLLATLVVRLRPSRRQAWLAVVAVSLFGITDEWHQSFTPGREVEVADWVADTGGAAIAVALYLCVPRYRALLETPLGRKRRVENPAPIAPVSAR